MAERHADGDPEGAAQGQQETSRSYIQTRSDRRLHDKRPQRRRRRRAEPDTEGEQDEGDGSDVLLPRLLGPVDASRGLGGHEEGDGESEGRAPGEGPAPTEGEGDARHGETREQGGHRYGGLLDPERETLPPGRDLPRQREMRRRVRDRVGETPEDEAGDQTRPGPGEEGDAE